LFLLIVIIVMMLVEVVRVVIEDAFSSVTVGCGEASGSGGKEMVVDCGGSGRQGACYMMSEA